MSDGRRLQTKGIRQYQEHDYETAIKTFQESIEEFQNEEDEIGVGEQKVNIGLCYRAMDQYEKALDAMQEGLTIFQEHDDRLREAQAKGNMALVYAKQDNIEQASTLYREAAAIFREEEDDENYGETILALADAQFRAGQLMEAVATFEVGLDYVHNPSARQRMAKQMLVVKNRLLGQQSGAKSNEGGSLRDRRKRRKLRREKPDE